MAHGPSLRLLTIARCSWQQRHRRQCYVLPQKCRLKSAQVYRYPLSQCVSNGGMLKSARTQLSFRRRAETWNHCSIPKLIDPNPRKVFQSKERRNTMYKAATTCRANSHLMHELEASNNYQSRGKRSRFKKRSTKVGVLASRYRLGK